MQIARGVVVLVVLSVNTILLSLVLFVCALAKLLSPNAATLGRVRRFLAKLPVLWISVNNALFALMRITRWDVEVPRGLSSKGCYAVISNHQTWADVLVLQRSFNRRLPFFRFFVKESLFWLPVLGQAWWALDMPFMKRYSKELMARRPELKGKDLENARTACEKFRGMPVAIMNFPEGTRFSEGKRMGRESSYRNLLEPRIGGIGQVARNWMPWLTSPSCTPAGTERRPRTCGGWSLARFPGSSCAHDTCRYPAICLAEISRVTWNSGENSRPGSGTCGDRRMN
jgi:hypothetical protein